MSLDGMLSRIVTAEGKVSYDAIDQDDLAQKADDIADADWRALRGANRYAWLINAYNVLALQLALRYVHGRRKGLAAPWAWLRFFVFSFVPVGGRRMNLFWLEFRHIKPFLRRDPRGHFALVCASQGCPPLRDGAYHGETLNEELDAAAQAFLRPGAGYTLHRRRGILTVSRILKWYRRDFSVLGQPLDVVAAFAPADDADWIKQHRPKVRFAKYDWSLNHQE